VIRSCAHPVVALLGGLATLGPLAPPAHGYDLIDLPPGNRRTLNLNLGDAPVATRGYGTTSWNQLARQALERWNDAGVGPLPDHGFFDVRAPAQEGNPCRRDGTSEVRFASTLCGWSWGGVLGVTISWIVAGKTVETDVILNGSIARDAYPGTLEPTLDFFRIMLHEFGHAAGLDHPDEAGQDVAALMNGVISHVDDLRDDDRAGARAVRWDPGPIGRMENFVRGFYTEILGRAPGTAELRAWASAFGAGPMGIDTAAAVVRAFLQSDEMLRQPRTLAEHVRLLYRALFDRAPAEEEVASWVALIAERLDAVLPGFVNSIEFQELGARTPPHVIVRRFYREVLGRDGADDEVLSWVANLAETGDWVALARGFLDSPEYLTRPRTLAQHVDVLYRTFLGRSPDAAESLAWVHALKTELARSHEAFLGSEEFAQRSQALFR
jgi:hypothetical protein